MSSSETAANCAMQESWSSDECLFIQLYTELAFAATRLDHKPVIFLNNVTLLSQFNSYFAAAAGPLIGDNTQTSRKMQDYVDKLDRLVSGLLWRIHSSNTQILDRMRPKLRKITITPDLMARYRLLREKIDLMKVITHPEDESELWQFLKAEAAKQYLETPPVDFAARKTRPSESSTKANRYAIAPEQAVDMPDRLSLAQDADSLEDVFASATNTSVAGPAKIVTCKTAPSGDLCRQNCEECSCPDHRRAQLLHAKLLAEVGLVPQWREWNTLDMVKSGLYDDEDIIEAYQAFVDMLQNGN